MSRVQSGKWQRFEHFVGFFRLVKSIAFRNTPVNLSALRTGARFGGIGGVVVTEPKSRKLLEAVHQYDTQSVAGDSLCTTTHAGGVGVSDTGMNAIVISDTSASSAGTLSMGVELRIGSEQVQCNEVLQCKLLQTKKKLLKDDYTKERAKAVNMTSDVFLLITSGRVNKFKLPLRCGIVSITEFPQYFGPFASRAYRSFSVPPDINVASNKELCRVEGLGAQMATKILAKRKIVEAAVNRLCKNRHCKSANVIRGLYCAGV